jgi:hypothetical protein
MFGEFPQHQQFGQWGQPQQQFGFNNFHLFWVSNYQKKEQNNILYERDLLLIWCII